MPEVRDTSTRLDYPARYVAVVRSESSWWRRPVGAPTAWRAARGCCTCEPWLRGAPPSSARIVARARALHRARRRATIEARPLSPPGAPRTPRWVPRWRLATWPAWGARTTTTPSRAFARTKKSAPSEVADTTAALDGPYHTVWGVGVYLPAGGHPTGIAPSSRPGYRDHRAQPTTPRAARTQRRMFHTHTMAKRSDRLVRLHTTCVACVRTAFAAASTFRTWAPADTMRGGDTKSKYFGSISSLSPPKAL